MGGRIISKLRRLAHGWELSADAEIPATWISGFLRPAVRSVPPAMARRLGFCRICIAAELEAAAVVSRWTDSGRELKIELAAAGLDGHDLALELLLCLGQALWTKLPEEQQTAYWLLLDDEIRSVIPGEIDEEALRHKKALLSGRSSGASRRRLERYGAASFAGTAAEYVHSLWHDVSVREGPDFLSASALRRRLELFSRWFPPARGYQLFPRE